MIIKNYMIVSKNKYFNNFITIKVKKKHLFLLYQIKNGNERNK